MWQIDGVKVSVLTWGDLSVCFGHEFEGSNPCSDAGLNCQKSAEAIVPGWIYTPWEGLNNRRTPAFARYEEMRRQQTTS